MGVIYADGYVIWYSTKGAFTKISESGYVDKQQTFSSCSFPIDENDEMKIVVMGSDGTKGNIKVINQKEEVKQNFFAKETKCTHHTFVETLSGT